MSEIFSTFDLNEDEKRKVWENLAEWDSLENPLAPLTDEQLQSVHEIAKHCDPKYASTALVEEDSVGKTASETQTSVDEADCYSSLLSGKKIIATNRQWEFIKEKDTLYRTYLKQLQHHEGDSKDLLEQIDNTLCRLAKLKDQYSFVSNKTNSLHEACEQMLADQNQLSSLADDLEQKLSYFLEYEKIQSQLSSPTISVHGDLFHSILDRLDKCIEYMQEHPSYKESSLYLTKYRVSLNSALSLVRSWVLHALEQCVQQARNPDEGLQSTGDSYAYALLYGKFRMHAEKMKNLMTDIERRCDKGPEYEQLLSDCQMAYFNQRSLLMRPSVTESLNELSRTYVRDHCALTRSACSFLLRVCHDEWQLYHQFFQSPSVALDQYLDQLCGWLYDLLRPHIIHSNHMETLAELCSILRVEMIEEQVNNSPDELAAFYRVAFQLLSDVQERLVYRAHIYVQNDILGYKPVAGDLAYPEKLEMMKSIAEGLQNSQTGPTLTRSDSSSSTSSQEAVRSHTGNSPADIHGMWYPPLRRALLCMSKLYRSVDRSTFQGLSQEVLAAACAAIGNAADQIMGNKTTLDAHLFHIKHLLILREQIAPFQVDFAVKEMSLDFSSVKHAALGLINKRGRLFSLSASNALLEFLLEGAPQVKEHLKDSRRLADRQLKSTCEAFIDYCGDFLIGPIRVFLAKAEGFLKPNPSDSSGLKQQPFGQPEVVGEYVLESQKTLKTRLPNVQHSLQLYLANRETEFILFRPVKNLVVSSFQQLNQLLLAHYTEEEQTLIAAPTPEQISVILSALLLKRPETASSETSQKAPEVAESPKEENIQQS